MVAEEKGGSSPHFLVQGASRIELLFGPTWELDAGKPRPGFHGDK
jgi:hypothetical protein